MPQHVIRLSGLTLLTLVAFAGNSLLTRAALVDPANDALSFTAVRLISGALCLLVVAILTSRSVRVSVKDVPAVLALFVYAVGFSLAYNRMGAATGALVLFAMVQATMLVVGLWRGMRLPVAGMVGVALAMAGLVWLLLPGLSAPPVGAAALMAVAGIAWGVYSLLGQGSRDPIGRTARNFIGTVPLALVLLWIATPALSSSGWVLALASGVLTSALGYVLWYRVLPELPAPVAASAQLAVPVIAAFGGVLFLGEAITVRLALASILILAGIALTTRK